ncbi:aminotransferase class I/II-fold pyridoxal phosphate-dependent enzyme [Luteolibacter luteus]|uniref:Pyridoxal phosphate-dependent aminotransferase family protein n=1 Tax=Luteolibacter luteus TaxID=2728835 RepID=A0A858RGC6_9BACT|nr:pyridoxal phosphate-dependent aminotransferase family protein [Luteolibacter luteus]QJE95765.1 pyridoxal phosphate-dependent aminotransferase family protein [Luteolibacter luteus]
MNNTAVTSTTMHEVPLMESAPGPEVIIDGRSYHYFGGTSYYGLHGHPEVIAAGCEGFQRYGFHTATSRAGFGNSAPLLEVERRAAEHAGREAGFYFSSGYASNHVLIHLVLKPGAIFIDEAAHFCVMEAAHLPAAPIHRFHSRDAADLQAKIEAYLPPGTSPLVMSDGVVPATGQLPPLDDYVGVLARYAPATLLVDDAHGLGVLGDHGRGSLEHLGLEDAANGGISNNGVSILCGGTLGKAMGGFGGIVTGSTTFMQLVRSSSHYYDGASAPPSPVATATAKALELIAGNPSFREDLRRNTLHLRRGLRELGLSAHDVPSAQVGVAIGNAVNMARLHQELRSQGFLVPVTSYAGTGPEGIMRFAVCSAHTPQVIDDLLSSLRGLL